MALREINLIPSDILSSRYLRRHLLFWAVLLIALLSLPGSFYAYQTQFVLNKERPMKNLENIHALIGTKIDDIYRIQAELERLDQQQGVLKTIKRNLPYSSVLYQLSNIMNEYAWLTSLTIDSTPGKDRIDNDKLELTGLALSNDKLGNFLISLSSDDLFKDVVLKYAKEIRGKRYYQASKVDKGLIQFQITCRMYEDNQ
ncbi:metalloendopeptidase [Candidatus Scalindua japonica]|uniref:Metalloendopeptidase n=1 Tax=Candidatus Scalindua japonica TaxID=1284222 RepID=A0A286TTJ0_9BACT|nr:PilN domain-containing protein [Candidatus Scalindua japonica]GAX59229.1 metalloendopeptidase [Candidatus Scalindua japonica]